MGAAPVKAHYFCGDGGAGAHEEADERAENVDGREPLPVCACDVACVSCCVRVMLCVHMVLCVRCCVCVRVCASDYVCATQSLCVLCDRGRRGEREGGNLKKLV